MGAAKLLLVGWNAAASWICALLLVCHHDLLAGFHGTFSEAA